jgi:hypothetical protein
MGTSYCSFRRGQERNVCETSRMGTPFTFRVTSVPPYALFFRAGVTLFPGPTCPEMIKARQ